ncbi:NarK/NasA family nitrate transporter [Entomomonas moraniae]|uniref:NarK/NasA family nitrate transporter n=1 Tax=Entomomonas moraniae TaxID=2213226 RepID=A0A3Q9JIT4_9GAMM|nr:nitrate/nitrite transporter [Entomomonas moraniae]AZS50472.1 NarK/NasA family nitrate transporter [Entomomonas moraniae]
MIRESYKPYAVLTSSTIAFTVCFMIWMMFAVIGVPLQKQLNLTETQFGILTALPVLSGSLIRVPLGIWTDRFGGRIVFFILMMSCVIPIFLLQYATAYWQLLVIGLFVGLAGGSFSVGTPYVARWFTSKRQGLAMGIFGAGNAGAAVNKLIAPTIVAFWGWQMVANVYAIVMLVTAMLFFTFSYSKPEHIVPSTITLKQQLAMMKNPAVLRYCQYYSVVFGGYVGLSLWMVHYYVAEYGFSLTTAAFLAACFSLPGGVLRAFGGWLSDKYGAYKITWSVMWVCLVVFFILSYPQTKMLITTVTPEQPLSLNIGINAFWFTVLLFFAGIAMAIGKASVFKFISDEFPENIGTVSGVVGLAGGLGGFLLPIMFGALVDLTGIRSTSFMLLFGAVVVSLIWMHFSFKAMQIENIQKAQNLANK